MKMIKLSSAMVLGTLLVGVAGESVNAAEYTSADTAEQNASVTLSIDESGGNIIDPEDPENPIDPVDPENPGTNQNEGLLKINYVSDLNFGGTDESPIEYAGRKLVLDAAMDTNWVDSEGNARTLNPFINIEDRRVDGDGTEDGAVGIYTVTATMNEDGFSNGTTTIKGAEINLGTTTNTYGDTATVNDLTIGAGENVEIINATSAIASNSVSFNPATLTIPSNIVVNEGTYNAVITWNVTGDTPEV